MRSGISLLAGTALLLLLAVSDPQPCQAAGDVATSGLHLAADEQRTHATHVAGGSGGSGGRVLLQAGQGQEQEQGGEQAAGQRRNFDITVEEAILETYAPDKAQQKQQQQQRQAPQVEHGVEEVPQPLAQQQQQQQQRRQQLQVGANSGNGNKQAAGQQQQQQQQLQQDLQAQAADHARLRQQRAKLVVKQQEAKQQLADEQGQAAVLGRQALRRRKSQAAAKQPVVQGSRKGDVFAEQTEKALAAVRQRMSQHREAAAAAAALAARQQRAGAGSGGGGAAAKVAAKVGKAQQAQQAKVQAKVHAAAGSGQQQQQQQAVQRAQQARQALQTEQAVPAAQPHAKRQQRIPLSIVAIMTIVMAAAAGLGALPFFFVRSLSATATGVATAVACGVMLAASFDLVHEGQPYGAALTVGGVLLGGAFIRWVQQHLEEYEDIQFGSLQGSSARKTVLMVGIMAAHALGEGCAVGVSFCGERGWAQGVLTTLAIGVHNVPEGLAKATVLVGQGVSPPRALMWSILTCLPQPLVAVPAFIFVEAFTMILPVALGFAAGCMIWMVFAELLPDAMEEAQASQVATAATMAAAGLEGFRMLFASMEQADGTLGGGAAMAAAGAVLNRMGPALLVLLPAVAGAAVAGGGVASTAIPAPVAWGAAAAVAASSGGGALLDQLLWRPQVPLVHTAAAAAVGVALAVVLHRQLLTWAHTAAHVLAARLGGKNGNSAARSSLDVEALDQVNHQQQQLLQQEQYMMQHQLQRHHLLQPFQQAHGAAAAAGGGPPVAADVYVDGTGALNGFGGSSSATLYQAPYHRGSSVGGSKAGGGLAALDASGTCTPSGLGGSSTPRRTRAALLLPAPQLAAAAAALLSLVAGAAAQGWRVACGLLLLGTDRSSAILPAVLLLMVPGLGAGALARTLPAHRSGTAMGAWGGGLLAAVAAAAAALMAARAHESAHMASIVKSYLYPYGLGDTFEAVAAGALCVAAVYCFEAGAALKPSSTRGGLLLGLAAAVLLAALRFLLCHLTPYCLRMQVLLQAGR